MNDERLKEKIIGAKLTAEGIDDEKPIVIDATGSLGAVMCLAIHALASVTVGFIKAQNPTEKDWSKNGMQMEIIDCVQNEFASATLAMLYGDI
jgi:hypothetical protein